MQRPPGGIHLCLVRKAEKRAGHSGDGISVQRDLNPGLTSFMWTVLAPYNFVVSIVGFPSIESPMVGVGKARESLGSSRASMKNDKNSQENRGGVVGGHMAWAAVTRSWMSF